MNKAEELLKKCEDYGDVPFYFNVGDFFEDEDNHRNHIKPEQTKVAEELMQEVLDSLHSHFFQEMKMGLRNKAKQAAKQVGLRVK